MTVFLSYHSSRQAVVEHLAGYLQREGIPSWFAPRDVPAGAVWDEAIAQAIRSADALVLLFCASADSSAHVKREVMLADRAKVPIYWLRLERVEPDKLGYLLGTTQWIDWLDTRDATLESLVRDLKASAETEIRPAKPAPAASPQPLGLREPTGTWPRALLSFPTERQAAEVVAEVYFRTAEACPDSSLVLPTGRAATHIFRAMVRLARRHGERPFGEAHLINDTETFGVWPGHHTSRTRHVRETLVEPLRELGLTIDDDQLHLLTGVIMEKDPLRAAQHTIRLWPPAVHAVSMSPAGEILAYEVGTYNEPQEIAEDGVRVIELSEHGKGYIDPDQPSRSVLTIGLGTALSASTLLVPVLDGQKATILYRVMTGEPTAGVPATLLRRHLNAFVTTTDAIVRETGLDALAVRLPAADAVDLIMGGSRG